MKALGLDAIQAASAAQFDRQSENYGKGHILANTSDVEAALQKIGRGDGRSALDVATGGGHAALCLAKNGWRVTAGDISARMLENAATLLREAGFDLQTISFPAERIPFPDESFELVSVRVAPHHFSSVPDFCREAARVLGNGGHFLVIDGSMPDSDPETGDWIDRVEKWRDPSHGQLLSRDAWERMVGETGLEVILSKLEAMKMPDLDWYFQTAATTPEARSRVLEAVRTASPHVQMAMRIEEENGRIAWQWQRLTLVARKN